MLQSEYDSLNESANQKISSLEKEISSLNNVVGSLNNNLNEANNKFNILEVESQRQVCNLAFFMLF